MDELTVDNPPQLSDAVLVAAFGGWNDVGDVATASAQWLVERWKSRRFAWLDPEEFYDFTSTRPQVHLDNRGLRRLTWPGNDWYEITGSPMSRPLIVFVGSEPQLRWRHYTNLALDLADRVGVTTVVALGAYLYDVPHTRPPRLSGTSNDRRMRERLLRAGVPPSTYQGPTGIVSVLQDACRQRGRTAASIWGAVPHYISAAPNPRVVHAVLRALGSVLDLPLDLAVLEVEAQTFDGKVTSALESNPDVARHVRFLEQQVDAHDKPALPAKPEPSLPSGADLVEELERFLRSRQRNQPEDL